MGERNYTVYGIASVSVFTRVRATSKKHAISIAECRRSVPTLCHQCTGAGDERVEWALSDGIDGEAHNLVAEIDAEGGK
jgi:hypothetical protein